MTEVTIITPTTGSTDLLEAIASIKNQNYNNYKHLIVIDGLKFQDNFSKLNIKEDDNLKIIQLHENTGGGGFYGHRIYAGFSHLVNSKYISFLDQDNTYDEDHLSSCIETLESVQQLNWVYSLRKIIDSNNTILAFDNCESLGHWPTWNSIVHNSQNPLFHIDTSAYFFKSEFIKDHASNWHYGYGGDRFFYETIRKKISPLSYACTKKYSLNYRLAGNANSVSLDFFTAGNEFYSNMYGNQLPWNN